MRGNFICEVCGEVFDEREAGRYAEIIGEGLMRGPYTYFMICPRCGSEEITDAGECDYCGEVFAENELLHSDTLGGMICRKCGESLHTELDEFLEK